MPKIDENNKRKEEKMRKKGGSIESELEMRRREKIKILECDRRIKMKVF